jgi:hypothetical protein
MSPAETREAESRWALPTALASFLAVVLVLGSSFLNEVSGTGNAEILRSVHAHGSSVTLVSLVQALAFLLLILPLVYLFRAVRARSPRVRPQLLGLIVAAPLFIALSTGLSGFSRQEAADQFVAGEAKSTLSRQEAKERCESEEGAKAKGACERDETEDEEASNAIGEASLTPLVTGLGLAGALGLVVVFLYCGLWGLRTGILTRFWGSLGMGLGIVILLGLLPLALVWFIYFGLLVLGKLPGGRPPAWEAGEAVPWPTPGEKAAAELEPSDGPKAP